MVNEKVLVVEDEQIIAMEIQSKLKNHGYSCALASSGEEAIKKAGEIRPSIVLMDIMLNGDMDGTQAAEQIRTLFDIPIIYITAYTDENTLERAKITQPFGYLVKPFVERELYIAIEIALYKHNMEKKVKESEGWLSATLKSIGDAVIATDEKRMVKLMNPFAEALTGWKEEEAIGKPLKDVFKIIGEETGEEVEDPITKVTREGVFFGLANHNLLITKDGRKMPVDIIGTRIIDERSNIIGTVLVFYDTLDRNRIEKFIFHNKT
ncbi:MAG: response regulator [Candidatus Methanoperedens sp.]|nr:response regulator [Candidatus Methanoperedens sp.]MCZ7370138.1 response regulator [Candidatus Methanoperedens sp.]